MRRIAGVKRVDKRIMEELKEDVGVKESFWMKPAKSWLNWAGHVNRMKGGWVTKRADTLKVLCIKRR